MSYQRYRPSHRSLVVAALVLLGFAPATADVKHARRTALPTDVAASLAKRIDYGRNVSVAVALVDSAGTDFYSFGTTNGGDSKAVDENTVYEIGSITKTFTALILADMVGNGELKLEDPVQRLLPEGVMAPRRGETTMQLVHLATHTSGLPRMPTNFDPADPSNPYADYDAARLYAFLGEVELQRDVGAKYEYSNYGMGMLGQLLAERLDTTYDAMVQERVLKELGMKSTGVVLTKAMNKRLAPGHSGGRQVANWDLTSMAGAGALRSSAKDMARYIAANMGARKSSLYPAMKLTHTKRPETDVMALGWHYGGEDQRIVWHNGGTGGYRAFAGFLADGSKGVVVLTNSTESVDDVGMHLLDPSTELVEVKRSADVAMRPLLEQEGVAAAIAEYRRIKASASDEYEFRPGILNTVGYQLLAQERHDDAVKIFELNVAEYPNDANVFDSLAEAYMKRGDDQLAVENYRKSLELNPGNDNAVAMLAKLGAEVEITEVELPDSVLAGYVGRYQLAPSFIIAVTVEDGELKAQATGQQRFDLFVAKKDRFYLKVVNAQIDFNRNADGTVESLTLHQGGASQLASKID